MHDQDKDKDGWMDERCFRPLFALSRLNERRIKMHLLAMPEGMCFTHGDDTNNR